MRLSRNTLGALLIMIGLVITLGNLGWMEGAWVLFFLGLALIAAYAWRGGPRHGANLGLLIPGSILLMLWAFVSLEENVELGAAAGALFFISLSVAFFAIFFIHTRFQEGASRFWPAITGGSLLAFGLVILSIEVYDSPLGRSLLRHAASVGLVVAGVIILIYNRERR